MPATSFSFELRPLGTLLKAGRLGVPPNQRSYKWDKRHVLNLLQDFDEAITNDDRDYFLGTVVLVDQQKERPLIQDGRQRLATTTMLLARIRDKLHDLA